MNLMSPHSLPTLWGHMQQVNSRLKVLFKAVCVQNSLYEIINPIAYFGLIQLFEPSYHLSQSLSNFLLHNFFSLWRSLRRESGNIVLSYIQQNFLARGVMSSFSMIEVDGNASCHLMVVFLKETYSLVRLQRVNLQSLQASFLPAAFNL